MAQSIAKGDIALTVDELELEASLRFTPDPNGAEWSGEKILRLVMDAKIGGLNQKRADDIVGKFSRARSAVTEIVAKGQPPVEPRLEEVEWAELEVPPEWKALVEESLQTAADPELHILRSEVVRTEKTVKKPGALPFLPPKIEKVVVSEKREKRERVYPDLNIVKTGYAQRGERLGLLCMAQPGKAGKTIFGKPLQPAGADAEPTFVLGPGIERRKTELFAEREGILRAGARWAEILPFGAHSFAVEKAQDGATYFLDYRPGDRRLPAPKALEILAKAAELGAPEGSLLGEEELDRALATAAAKGEPLFALPLSLDRDGRAEVAVSPDGTRATLSLWKGRGRGKPLELAAVTAALKAAALKGVKSEQLKKDVLEFHKGPDSELLDYLLVEGSPPVRGKDRTIGLGLSFLPDDKAAELRGRILAHPALSQTASRLDEFPIDEAVRLAFVQAGQRLGELSAASPGQPGLDVRGAVLPGIPGNDPIVKLYEGVELSRGLLVATGAGLFVAAEREGAWRFRVLPCRDASIEVSVAPDAMAAYLSLRPEEGLGAPLTVEGALAAIAAKGVVFGHDAAAVAEAVAAARAGQAVLHRPVAAGRPAVPSGGQRLEWLVRLAPQPGAAASGSQVRSARVAAGEKILRAWKTGDSGEDGLDVLGKPVSAPPASGAAGLTHDASVREEPGEGGSTVFVAAAAGELREEAGRLSVRERLALEGDVGPKTGNLRFPGSVRVAGSVLTGFQLVAGGDAAIAGFVEAALVSSDGGVVVGSGVKGAKRGTIRAKRSIETVFAEQALLLAVEDVKVKSSCVLCNVKTNGGLLVAADKGALVGGIVRARKGVDAAQIGSENGIKTEISFGQDYLVADMIEAEAREIEKLKGLIVRADRTMAELERAGAGLDQVRQDKVKLVKLLEKRSIRLFDLREKFEEHHPSEVRVRGTIYPGVILESHNRFFEVRSRKTRVVFSFDPQSGRIVERPL